MGQIIIKSAFIGQIMIKSAFMGQIMIKSAMFYLSVLTEATDTSSAGRTGNWLQTLLEKTPGAGRRAMEYGESCNLSVSVLK